MNRRWLTTIRSSGKAVPCVEACPAHINVPEYVRLISVGNYKRALSVIRERVPFPAVLGRVCTKPCEIACSAAGHATRAISIKMLKWFAADSSAFEAEHQSGNNALKRESKIAIVGAGPAGLTAAYNLARYGYDVLVFEAESEAGGALVWNIPAYRLPKSIVREEVALIEHEGVKIKLNCPIRSEQELNNLLNNGYSAVFIATGASKSRMLNIEGESYQGVHTGLSFLRRAKTERHFEIGKNVVVIGGGNVAIDAARTAVRLGAERISILYRRARVDMPAIAGEISRAYEEGVEIKTHVVPVEILGKGKSLNAVLCKLTCPGKVDGSGRSTPMIVENSEFIVKADVVIKAVGEVPDVEYLGSAKEKILKKTTENVDQYEMTGMRGVFAGGDFVRGPSTVIEAIADGIKAAEAIHQYISGESKSVDIIRTEPSNDDFPLLQGIPLRSERKDKERPVNERVKDFEEELYRLDEDEAVAEATECLKCDLPIMIDESKCTGCLNCMIYCSLSNHSHHNPYESFIRVVSHDDGCNEIHFLDDCVGCGMCARICPFGALKKAYGMNGEEG